MKMLFEVLFITNLAFALLMLANCLESAANGDYVIGLLQLIVSVINFSATKYTGTMLDKLNAK